MTYRAILLALMLALLSLSQPSQHRKLRNCPWKQPSDKWNNCVGAQTDGAGQYVSQFTPTNEVGQYVGEFRFGARTGQGTYTSSNGDKIVGDFRFGVADGRGTYTFAKGGTYVGEFRHGKLTGQGTYTFANGDKYVGGWRERLLEC